MDNNNSEGIVTVQIPKIFAPFLEPHRYKGAYGGRGSGKSMAMAILMILKAASTEGFRAVCIREVQNTLKESSKRLLEDVIQRMQLGYLFEVQHDQIRTPGGGTIIFMGMQDSSAENIKSLEGMDVAWVEEAQTLSPRSLQLLRPTIRKEGSELWFSWNSRRKQDAVDQLLRGSTPPTDAVVLRVNWSDNKFFPPVLEQERLDCLRNEPDQYPHIWEGEYLTILTGAYFAASITQAIRDNKIGKVSADPLLPFKAFIDIGGTGRNSDAFVIWICQFVGAEIRVLNYYEVQGQPMAAHATWLRENRYMPYNTYIYLPHDGVQQDQVHSVSYESAFMDMGYAVTSVKNQGRGAALQRIGALRRLFPNMYFNEDTTKDGLASLSWYHAKIDDARNIDLGPDHDWASHGADAAGLIAIVAQSYKQNWDPALDNKVDYWATRSTTAGSNSSTGYKRPKPLEGDFYT